jgi:hypothetical protein
VGFGQYRTSRDAVDDVYTKTYVIGVVVEAAGWQCYVVSCSVMQDSYCLCCVINSNFGCMHSRGHVYWAPPKVN